MKTFKLTKGEFIKRSMAGDKFIYDNNIYYYNNDEKLPFRFDGTSLHEAWQFINGSNEFTLVKPKPKTEKQYLWRYNNLGDWKNTATYYSEKDSRDDWVKLEYTEIEVEV